MVSSGEGWAQAEHTNTRQSYTAAELNTYGTYDGTAGTQVS